MCGTSRDPSSQTCSYCGYIYEDQLTSGPALSDQVSSYAMNNTSKEILPSSFSKKENVVRTQENVICKNSLAILEGTLFLTDRRLVFVAGQELDEGEDIQKMLDEADALSIPLDQVVTASGNRGILRQSLNIVWHNPPDSPSTTKTEFLQKNRPRNVAEAKNAISEWVPQIEETAVSEVKTEQEEMVRSSPSWDQLDSKVLQALGDMKWKGFFQLERELEETYGASLDPDDLETSCKRLVKGKLIEQDKYGAFFKKLQIQAGSNSAG